EPRSPARRSRTARGHDDGPGAGRAARPGVRAPRAPEYELPVLRPADGYDLEPGGDCDGLEFADMDLADGEGRGANILGCVLRRCALDRADLRRARLVDTLLEEVRGVGTDLAEAVLRDVELVDARLGGVQLSAAELNRVRVRGGKIDYLNLRQARLTDVVFEGCVLVEPDFGGATLERVSFEGCDLRGVDLNQATLRDTDLRGVAGLEITRGVERLEGAVVTPAQLLDLAPVLAAAMGLRVEN
ncbi:pentapeptide repeat-containing protein, partial [Streptomyces sp. SM14]